MDEERERLDVLAVGVLVECSEGKDKFEESGWGSQKFAWVVC